MTAHKLLRPEEIIRLKKNATAISLTVGGLMLFIKIGAWAITDSVSVLTSLMDAIFDSAVGVMNYLAVRQALRPANRFFRFGFGKLEPLAALAESVFLAGVAIMIVIEAINRFGHPYLVANTGWGILAMWCVIVLTSGLVLYQRHIIRLTGSLVIQADSIHYATDIVTHLGILASLFFSGMMGATWIDPTFAVGIACYLIWNAKEIFSESLGIILDRELSIEERNKIRDTALSHPQVHDIHDLRTRSSGGQIFIQLHVEMDPDLSLRAAYGYSEEIIDRILEVLPNAEIQIHEEPIGMPRYRSWCQKAGLPETNFSESVENEE